MKITIDISDPLLERAKATARDRGVTLRELVESGLVHVLATQQSGHPFRLRDASFHGGRGLQQAFAAAHFASVLAAAHEGPGSS